MEYRVYPYTHRGVPGTPRRRRHIRRQHGISPVFRLVLFGAMLIIALLILRISLPTHLERNAAHCFVDETKPSTIETIPTENDSMADAVEHNPIVAVEPTIAPTVPPTEMDNTPGREYDFSAPVPESPPVEDGYFDDAVFIGDSRTEGLILNTGLSNATAYAYKGLMVDTVFTKPVVNKDGQKLSVMDALKSTQFSKVYIMLGINETGWAYSQIFQSKYGDVIDYIREINPAAVIYIQGIMPVSNKVSSTHSYITNTKINEYNLLLRELAEEKQVYYIDTENAVASEDGSLPADAATDGIHLVKDYCEKWLDYVSAWENMYDIQFDLMLPQTDVLVKTRQRKKSKSGSGDRDIRYKWSTSIPPAAVCAMCEAERPGHPNVRPVSRRCAPTKRAAPLARFAAIPSIALGKLGICIYRCEKWRFTVLRRISILLVGAFGHKPLERRFSICGYAPSRRFFEISPGYDFSKLRKSAD